ncbi:MAG: tetratricopeptide repeat protein [Thermosynechococcaceae cyanobacterium]
MGRKILNWLQKQFHQWVEAKNALPPQAGGALAKGYGEDLQDPNALIHRANKRATGGDVEGAFADFNEAIQLSPARATAYYNRGFLHNTLGNFEAAIEDFNRVMDLLPDYDEAFYQRGNSHLQLKNLPSAIQDFSRAIQLNPYSIKSYYKRAEAYADVGDVGGALADYAQVVTRIPQDANAYYQRGQFLAKNGEMRVAVEDFTKAINYNPRHADAYCNRGCCYAELGEMEKASQDFNQALLHNPSHQAAYYQRMYSLGILKESAATLHLNQALPPIEPKSSHATLTPEVLSVERVEPSSLALSDQRTVKLEPESLMGYFERASRRAVNGDIDGAIADYTKIIDLDPHNTQAFFRRGQNYGAIGENEAAMADLNQALHWARVNSLGRLKDFSGALTETIETLKTELNKPRPSEVVSTASGTSIESAIAEYTQIIAANPTHADTYFKRAKSRALLGDLKGAIADYTETIRLNPDGTDAYYRRGLIRSAMGDVTGATADLNQAIRLKPLLAESSQISGSISQPTLPIARIGTRNATANLNPGSYCNHQGNRPDTRFCIHCGEPLVPMLDQTASEGKAPLSLMPPNRNLRNAEDWLERGRLRCERGELKAGLIDLGNALKLFLEQQQMDRYQTTLDMIQQFSQQL